MASKYRSLANPTWLRWWLFVAVTCVLLLAACTSGPSHTETPDGEPSKEESLEAAISHAVQIVDEQVEGARISAAIAAVKADFFAQLSKVTVEENPALAKATFLALVQQKSPDHEAVEALLKVWTPDPEDIESQKAMVRWAISLQRWELARETAWSAAVRFEGARGEFMALWYESFASDEVFLPPTLLTLKEGEHMTKFKVMARAGTSIIYKLKMKSKTVGVFKAMQKLWLSNYRGEIAAYRLCPLIRCGFSIPHNQDARVAKDVFDRVDQTNPEWIKNRKGKGIKLIWFKDKDAENAEYLHGTLKEWVPGFTLFPIEDTKAWGNLLLISKTSKEKLLGMSFRKIIGRFKADHRKKHDAMMERQNGTTGADLARQLSNLHVLDLLTGNWDRYSTQPYPGLNCQWNHGHFVSIDNGATFQNKRQKKSKPGRYNTPKKRLERRVQRFSRSTIQAVRWMDTDALQAILFPKTAYHPEEKEVYALFLERRIWLLKYVDGLIKKHGEDEVLVFP